MRLWFAWPPWKEPEDERLRKEFRENLTQVRATERKIAGDSLDSIEHGIKEAREKARAALQSRPDVKEA